MRTQSADTPREIEEILLEGYRRIEAFGWDPEVMGY